LGIGKGRKEREGKYVKGWGGMEGGREGWEGKMGKGEERSGRWRQGRKSNK